jgi:hypothetical protein
MLESHDYLLPPAYDKADGRAFDTAAYSTTNNTETFSITDPCTREKSYTCTN